MGNMQANEKQPKMGKSPAKGKHFIKNLNRKSPGRESRKQARRKSDAKRNVISKEFDKTPDSDIIDTIVASDNDTVECLSESRPRDEADEVESRAQYDVTVSRCESQEPVARSPTLERPAIGPPLPDVSPNNDSASESVFTEPLTPLAVELNQCYYSAESDSAHEEPPRTLTPSQADAPAHAQRSRSPDSLPIDMPETDAASSLSTYFMDKEEKLDTCDESSDRSDNEKVMGSILSTTRSQNIERNTHECSHEFRENRLKASPAQTSFTVSKHKKVELPPITSDSSLTILDNAILENDRRHSSVSDSPVADSNVLRKVASLTLEKLIDTKVVRPKFVPEKLDFQLYEKFEGQMLLNWFISSITQNSHLKNLLNVQDLRSLGIQYCTHLLAAGVLRQISDKNAPTENVFKPNLMYYWAHMEAPASQPVTPGRLQVSSWPPDKDILNTSQQCILSNRFINQNNNDDHDINEDHIIISELKKRIEDLECQLEKYRISTQIETVNKNSNNLDTIRFNKELVNKEVQTYVTCELNKLSNITVINTHENDPHITRTNTNVDSLDLSNLDIKNQMKHESIALRSENVENYCKLNKSREYNKGLRIEEIADNKNVDFKTLPCSKISIPNNISANQIREPNSNTKIYSSSEASFLSTYASTELISNQQENVSDLLKRDEILQRNCTDTACIPTTVLYSSDVKNKALISDKTSDLLSDPVIIKRDLKEDCNDSVFEDKARKTPGSTILQTVTSSNCSLPSLPEKSSLKGTISSQLYETKPPDSSLDTRLPLPQTELKTNPSAPSMPLCLSMLDTDLHPTPGICPPPCPTAHIDQPTPLMPDMSPPLPLMPDDMGLSSPPIPDIGAPPPPKSGIDQPPPTSSVGPSLPSMPGMSPVSPPMPSVGPPPPLMPGTGPPPPPMPGTGPPPPPMPSIGPSPPPMPGMGPPPPPIPGMSPPPPPMPGMGPPPPPMPGMGPPPPPMPGMGPPPPPMPGMGPPPPPMPGMGPPPPPMPGMGPPPPPMPGMGPPPPPMPGMCPPPPPMPGMVPPPPLMPGISPLPPPMPGMGIPTPSLPGSDTPLPPGVPPLPNLGPIPFPAPPVGGWNTQRATLRKIPVKPSAPMKPLYWTRILAPPPPVNCQGEPDSNTLKPLWLEIEETKLDNIEEFTDLFSRQVVKAPVKKKVEVKTKIQPIKILDSKRSQNVGILAQSLHVEFSEIENAIYNFDTSVISLEALQQIYELRANEEELSMIQGHLKNKPDIPLDKPEAFLHDLSGIPNFAERISCFMFQAEFDDAVSTTMHKLDNLKHTCEFLMTSESLKKLFAIILTLGNYMNGGNGQRGQADGFGLEILSKLKDVKSKQSNVTLLHFIVCTYMRSAGGALAPACALPVPEPGDVARAAALDFAEVGAGLAALTSQLTACKEKTKKVIETDAKSRTVDESSVNENNKRLEVFKDKMDVFLTAAEEKLKTEHENLEECRTKFIATVKFYQYTPKCGKLEDCEPKEFFSLWTSFCSDFKDIFKKEEQIAIKEKLKEAKKLQGERKSLTQPKKEGGLKARLQKLSSSRK